MGRFLCSNAVAAVGVFLGIFSCAVVALPSDIKDEYQDLQAAGGGPTKAFTVQWWTNTLNKLKKLPAPQNIQDVQPTLHIFNRKQKTPCILPFSKSTSAGKVDQCSWSGHLALKPRTIYIVHGFRESVPASPWMAAAGHALLAQEDANIVLVDWTKGATAGNYYPKAASNTQATAGWLARVVQQVKYKVGGVAYCVGFSLGAHVCGQVGRKAHLARVTGLDPAGPLFDNANQNLRLSKSSAEQVDVIHTHGNNDGIFAGKINPFTTGTMIPLGHVDYYPNGAKNQPGCAISRTNPEEDQQVGQFTGEATRGEIHNLGSLSIGCSHLRAHELFIESVGSSRCVARLQCINTDDLPAGCALYLGGAQTMGYRSGGKPGVYYLETNLSKPWCKG